MKESFTLKCIFFFITTDDLMMWFAASLGNSEFRKLKMGKLLSLLARDESTCCTPQKYDVFLDFESEFCYKTLYSYFAIPLFDKGSFFTCLEIFLMLLKIIFKYLQMPNRLKMSGKLLRQCREFWKTLNRFWKKFSAIKALERKLGKQFLHQQKSVNVKHI